MVMIILHFCTLKDTVGGFNIILLIIINNTCIISKWLHAAVAADWAANKAKKYWY